MVTSQVNTAKLPAVGIIQIPLVCKIELGEPDQDLKDFKDLHASHLHLLPG